jgi:hypothetical protein
METAPSRFQPHQLETFSLFIFTTGDQNTTVSSVINAMKRLIPGFTDQYDVEIQPGSANVQPKPTCFPNPESDRPQTIPEKICPASVSSHSPIPTPEQPQI